MTTVLQVENLAFKYRSEDRSLFSDVSFSLRQNEVVTLLGKNGCGKSTLLKLLSGKLKAKNENSQLKWFGHSVEAHELKDDPVKIRTLTQDVKQSTFGGMSVFENLLLAQTAGKLPRLCRIKSRQRARLAEFIQSFHPKLAQKLDQKVESLSGGERQALGLALCFLKPPKLLLLDEHTSALDPKRGEELMELSYQRIKDKGLCTLMSTHNLDHALKFSDRVLFLKDGKIKELSKDSKTRRGLLEQIY